MGSPYCRLSAHLYGILVVLHMTVTLSLAKPRLLIISLDGFRHQYLSQYSLPTVNRIQSQGVRTTHGMEPTFVTMTFPNHISLATGMYQEDHGIVHNRFYDTKLKMPISFGTGDIGQWSDARVEPIWITATKQRRKAAVIYWPASANEFHGVRPLAYTKVYSDSVPFREKIDNAINYFENSAYDLVMLYHFEPDKQGHVYGPDSKETYQALRRLDRDLSYLLNKVKGQLNNDLNIILLSDHGMANTTRIIRPFFEGFVDRSNVEDNILDGPLFSVTPRVGYFDTVFNGLRRIPHVTVYNRSDFPTKYHYAKAIDRIGEIIVIPHGSGTVFYQKNDTNATRGNHGYDNTLPSMQAIFMATGPDFQSNVSIRSLKNVDVYHIACRLLDLQPNPHATAGSLRNLSRIFRKRSNRSARLLISLPLGLLVFVWHFIV